MRKISGIIYFGALISSCAAMSFAFLGIDQQSNLLRFAVLLTLAYFFTYVISIRKLKADAVVMLAFIVVALSLAVVKMIYFGQMTATAPLMMISGLLILVTVVCGNNEFPYIGYVLVNLGGAIALILGILTNSHNTWGAVQIGHINPQTISAWALIYAAGTLLSYDYLVERVKCKKLLWLCAVALYGAMLYIAVVTQARFSLIIMVCLAIVRILPPLMVLNNGLVRVLMATFPILCLGLSELLYFTGMFRDMAGGSLLNGRERIWANYFGQSVLNPVFGVGYDDINANSFYTHNIFVDYCALFGFIATIVFFAALCYVAVYMVPRFKKKNNADKGYSRLKYDAFAAFGLIVVSSSVEGAFFSVGAGGLYIFTYGLLLIAVSKEYPGFISIFKKSDSKEEKGIQT